MSETREEAGLVETMKPGAENVSTPDTVKIMQQGVENVAAKKMTVGKTIIRGIKNVVEVKITRRCPHTTDGAVMVAEYIVQEIKINVKSKTAASIRYDLADPEELRKRHPEGDRRPIKIRGELQPAAIDFIAALKKWHEAVKTDSQWDHKQKIRTSFKQYAVQRPLRPKDEVWKMSESYYHKYNDYDYYLDVWSNIHYGYLGLSLGFDEFTLLTGSNLAQIATAGTKGFDTKDDDTAIKIGFSLHEKFGKYAEGLTAKNVLDALEQVNAKSEMPNAKQIHWCWHLDNPEPKAKPKEQ
jgi:hypothetical protein